MPTSGVRREEGSDRTTSGETWDDPRTELGSRGRLDSDIGVPRPARRDHRERTGPSVYDRIPGSGMTREEEVLRRESRLGRVFFRPPRWTGGVGGETGDGTGDVDRHGGSKGWDRFVHLTVRGGDELLRGRSRILRGHRGSREFCTTSGCRLSSGRCPVAQGSSRDGRGDV